MMTNKLQLSYVATQLTHVPLHDMQHRIPAKGRTATITDTDQHSISAREPRLLPVVAIKATNSVLESREGNYVKRDTLIGAVLDTNVTTDDEGACERKEREARPRRRLFRL